MYFLTETCAIKYEVVCDRRIVIKYHLKGYPHIFYGSCSMFMDCTTLLISTRPIQNNCTVQPPIIIIMILSILHST